MARCRGMNSVKILGAALMAAGFILLLILVPYWAWAGLLCVALIVLGFIIWKIG